MRRLTRPAAFHPALRHYKVLVPDPEFYDVSEAAAHYKTHWAGTSGRTGLPFPVRTQADLFVTAVRNYERCDRFDGTFPHAWNIGEAYRPDPPASDGEDGANYRIACDLAAGGDHEQARAALTALAVTPTPPALRALVENDLAVLSALAGDAAAARGGFRTALALNPECSPARANLIALEGARADRIGGRILPPTGPAGPRAPGPPGRAVRVAVVSLLFNWPSTGGGNVHTAELTMFLAAAGYDVRHVYARFEPWGLGRVADPTPHPAEPVAFAADEWTRVSVIDRFRRAIDEIDPDWVVLTDSWNLKPVLADAAGGRRYVLRLQALECLCPLNNVRLLPGPGGHPGQCTRHQLATPDACLRCVRSLGHTSGDLHRAERALAGVGTAGYSDIVRRAFEGAAAVLAVNPLIAAIFGQPNLDDVLHFSIGKGQFNLGIILTAIVNFVLIAAVVYFVLIVPVTKAREKFGPTPAEEAEAEEITLLREIRDSLQNKA